MFNLFKNLFGAGNSDINFAELLKQGAIIVDVRTPGEYANGHINGSINIPLDQLGKQLSKLTDKNKPIITCCASGMRSSSAKSILESNGYTQVVNGGGWSSLQSKL